MTDQFDNTEVLQQRLYELNKKWHDNLKTKDKAGGNSGDNYERIQIGIELEERKKNDD